MALLSVFKRWKETIADKNGNHIPIARWTRSEMVDRENGKTVEQSLIDTEDLIQSLSNRFNTLADSDDTTLDQISELVAYIKSNRSLIENITTNKINITDVIDNLTSTASNKPLSANQGKVLKELIDSLSSSPPQFDDGITAANSLQVAALAGGAAIAEGTDLDTLTVPGTYAAQSSAVAATLLHCPINSSGFVMYTILTYPYKVNTSYRTQIIICGASTPSAFWIRNINSSGKWCDWVQMKYTDPTNITGNAGTATKLATARSINGMSFDGSADVTNYAVCNTDGATAAKTVSCAGFNAALGAEIVVYFKNANTAANPTLNVNGTGAKPIYYRGKSIPTNNITVAKILTLRSTGTAYSVVGDINTDTTYASMTGATAGAAGKTGLVPAPAAGKQASFLRGDGIWFNPFAATNVTVTAKNTNDYNAPGVFYFAQDYTPINAPAGVVNGYLIVIAVTTTNIKQIWLRHGTVNSNDHEIYIRSYNGTNWSSWAKCITSKDAASLTVCYQGSFSSGTVTKALPSGKTKCLIIASKATTTHGLECGAHVLTGLSGSMTAVNHTTLWSSSGFTMLHSISAAGAITLETSGINYTMIYFA